MISFICYIYNVFIAIDQLANTLTGGNPDGTISGRVGYFASYAGNTTKYYWKTIEKVIDFSFYPIQGPGHCFNTYLLELEVNEEGNDFLRAILAIVATLFCIWLASITWTWLGVRWLQKRRKATKDNVL